MGKRTPPGAQVLLRERLAQESARLMIEHGIVDFGLAKRKAAERLSVTAAGALPSNAQIESCLAERQRIFEPEAHELRVETLRRIALKVMAWFAAFEPRLVGAVLSGTATANSAIELHLFASGPEFVAGLLGARGVPVSECERRYRFGGGRTEVVPGFRFRTDGARVDAMVFPENGIREAPLSHVDRRPMARAARAKVAELVAM
jgi:hypothetical protein